jgi:hypothetical protein
MTNTNKVSTPAKQLMNVEMTLKVLITDDQKFVLLSVSRSQYNVDGCLWEVVQSKAIA